MAGLLLLDLVLVTLVFSLISIWPGNYMLLMFWSGLDPNCMLCIIWDHCQVICCFDYIKFLFYTIFWLLWCFWAPTMVSLSKPLERLHSRFLQWVPVSKSFFKLTLAKWYHFHTAVQDFRVLYHLCPGYLRNWFVYAEAHTGHSGRNKHCLFIPQINTSIGKNEFFYHRAVIWNSLFPVLFMLMTYLI